MRTEPGFAQSPLEVSDLDYVTLVESFPDQSPGQEALLAFAVV